MRSRSESAIGPAAQAAGPFLMFAAKAPGRQDSRPDRQARNPHERCDSVAPDRLSPDISPSCRRSARVKVSRFFPPQSRPFATSGIVGHVMPSETRQFTVAIIGAAAVGITTFIRIAGVAPPETAGQSTVGA